MQHFAKQSLASGLVMICLGGCCAIGETYFVRPDGNDQAEGTTPQQAFKTILRAAHVFNHGDHLILAPGTYRGELLFAERFSADGTEMSITGDESGKLSGAPSGEVVIEAENPAVPALLFYRFRQLRLSGLTVRGAGQGLELEQSPGVVVERCTFDGLSRGLMIGQCQDVRVESAVFRRCTLGVVCQSSVRTRLAHLTVAGASSAGVLILSSGQGAIRNSLFADNNSNLIADEISAPDWSSDYNVLTGATGPWGGVPTIAKVYEWSAASGQDRHSVYVTPAFKAPEKYDLHPSLAVTWAGGLPGARVGRPLAPKVERDRDGKPFGGLEGSVSAGAYDYSEPPQGAKGWRTIGVNLHGQGPRQSAAVYHADGTLVRTLLADAAGVQELWWDGLDDLGQTAPAGQYQVRAVTHDVRLIDDGAVGDNGNPLGAYNCDNPDRVVALADGGFVITTPYDEAGYPLRRYSASGQPIFASNLAQKDYAAIARTGQDLYAVVGSGAKARLVHIVLPGDRARMANGKEDYPIFSSGEPVGPITGLAVAGGKAYVAAASLNRVRVIDLATGDKLADWPLPLVGDLAIDERGTVWAISGQDVVSLDASRKVVQRYATGLEKPQYLAAGANRLAIVDRKTARLVLLDAANGRTLHTLGKGRIPGEWTPVSAEVLRDPRGCAFLRDGSLALAEQARVRLLWPETGKVSADILSNFMDVGLVHPTHPEYFYCYLGVFRVDPKSGAWTWLVEAPQGPASPQERNSEARAYAFGSPSTSVVLGGRPFIAHTHNDRLCLFDVSDPLKPRLALQPSPEQKVLRLVPYSIISFTKNGDIIANDGNYTLAFARIPYRGLDPAGNPRYDFAHPVKLGAQKDPSPRGMKCINAPSADRHTGEIYYLAVTEQYKKMVPAWGADGTGVGKSTPEGKPLWFALSSGGNYQSGAAINDGKNGWYFAGKSFGGQIDVFDADGLRLTTGNWSWPCHYSIGFVDLRYGVQPYLRPDGKIGVYVEDDAIGRFARGRLEGAETVKRSQTTFDWSAVNEAAASPPDAHATSAQPLERRVAIPRIAPLRVDGDWSAWARVGVVPQIVSLPVAGYARNWPEGLWQTFRAGTAIGALAHDGEYLYAYFLVADDTLHFDAEDPGRMWEFDSVELWVEEEQIGLGLLKSGRAALFKYRFHSREGKEWSANYALPDSYVWGATLTDLASHPLGRQLANFTGVSLAGRTGYALMGKIPFIEIKLVGGIVGRKGGEIIATTGAAGEILRLGVAFDGICAWGHEQDYKVYWPAAFMYSDPTRNVPCVLE